MAKALPEDGSLFTLEKSEKNFAIAQAQFAISQSGRKIRGLCGDAVENLRSLSAQGPFDMVFIDANKGGYLQYLDWAAGWLADLR